MTAQPEEHDTPLGRLAAWAGVLPLYFDLWGKPHPASTETLKAVLSAMGFDVSSDAALASTLADLEAEEARRPADSVLLSVPGEPADLPAAIEPPAAPGVRDYIVAGSRVALITAPPKGFCPPTVEAGGGLWGINMPLYGLRSSGDWGVGDFGALAGAVRWAAGLGADFVGLLPLHALFNEPPLGIGPYYPSSRLFLNPIYIDVPGAPGADSAEFRDFSAASSERISALRALPLVDYAGVWALKDEALRLCHASFAKGGKGTGDFAAWRIERGEALGRFAAFTAMRNTFRNQLGQPLHWRDWPEEFRRPEAEALARFEAGHAEEVSYQAWLQWVADAQLAGAASASRDAGMEVGLYIDMALGVDPGGADAWSYQDLLALGASSGCPPDPFSLLGQKWGLPPIIPHRHRALGYPLTRDTIGANARHAGAVRIDHAAQLARLFWIPEGMEAKDGVYVAARIEEELALLRALSCLHKTSIIGEDLGTVPDEVRQGLDESGFFSYRLMMFEKGEDGRFKAPGEFTRNALASFGTHDLPTLDGWLTGRDLEVKRRLGRYPNREAEVEERRGRFADRRLLIEALKAEGYVPADFEFDMSPGATMSRAELDCIAPAVHARLARFKSALVLVNLDDMLGVEEMQNLPGTLDEHPNWRRRVPLYLEEWDRLPRAVAVAQAVNRLRGGRVK